MPTTQEADAARLAQLLGADSDSDSAGETDVDGLRTTELLNRPSDAAEDDDKLDHKTSEPVEAPEPSLPPAAPPAPAPPAPAPVVPAPPPQPRRASSKVLDRISSKLAELNSGAPPVDDETTARRFCEQAATAFDAGRTPEMAIECVWEHQSRDDHAVANLASAARATLTRNAIEKRAPGPWLRAEAPRAGILRRLQPLRRRPFEGCLAPQFERRTPPPAAAGLPDLSWRWLSPWQVDGRVHGTDRGVADLEEVGAPDAWLYAPRWPDADMAGYSYDDAGACVRCRRWVRPCERQTARALVRLLLARRPATRVASLIREAKSAGPLDLATLAARLVVVPVDVAPAPASPKHARGVTVDYVWENQRWIRAWAPCVGLRKQPFDGASRPQLAELFKRHGGPPSPEAELAPEESGLPLDDARGRSSSWRWLGPWVLDSTSFGAERVLNDGACAGADAWIYRFDWSRDGIGYVSAPTKQSFVRCRRWVRPREPADVSEPQSVDEEPSPGSLNFFS